MGAHGLEATAELERPGAAQRPSADSTRQRFSANGIFPPPIAGATFTQTQLALNFSYDIDLFGRNRAFYDAALGEARGKGHRVDGAGGSNGTGGACETVTDWNAVSGLRLPAASNALIE